jgi:pantetheine-phosphate adenylyltransferase
MRVCIGGTFNILHNGHKKLIDTAFQIAGKNGSVFIGVTTGGITSKKTSIKTYEERKDILIKYLKKKGFFKKAIIKPITNKYGPSIDKEFDAIIVSAETFTTAEEINKKRNEKGKKPLEIIKIPLILADDGIPISSTRINKKEIDIDGRILSKD